MSDYPLYDTKMKLTFDQSMKKPQWICEDSYLKNIFSGSSYNVKELASWFNVSPKTINEWRNKIIPPKDRKKKRKK